MEDRSKLRIVFVAFPDKLQKRTFPQAKDSAFSLSDYGSRVGLFIKCLEGGLGTAYLFFLVREDGFAFEIDETGADFVFWQHTPLEFDDGRAIGLNREIDWANN